MSTDIVVSPADSPVTFTELAVPSRWVAMVQPAGELAKRIASTEFVPKGMRGNVAAVAACILYGDELGLGPMQALSKIDVINGVPSPRAELARALVLAAGHEFWIEEQNNTRAVVCGQRAGSDKVFRTTYTIDDARAAGLLGKGPWKANPRQMLLARASAELCRNMAPDCLGGITRFVEEDDDDDERTVDPATGEITAPAPKARKRSLTVAAPAPEPPLPGEDEPPLATVTNLPSVEQTAAFEPPLPGEDDGVPQAPPITSAMLRKVFVLYGKIGVKERDDCLSLGAQLLGFEFGSHNDLTVAQGNVLIDMLSALSADDVAWSKDGPSLVDTSGDE